MKILLIFAAIFAVATAVPPKRAKRAAYDLPNGAHILVVPIKTSFICFNDGYYADVDNNCQIFHVCHSSQQWSFLCGNQTIFNQLTLTCADPKDAIPCAEATRFYSINARLNAGDPKLYFLTDDDIVSAAPLLNRLKGGYTQVPVYSYFSAPPSINMSNFNNVLDDVQDAIFKYIPNK